MNMKTVYITLAVLLLAVSLVSAYHFKSQLDKAPPRLEKGIGLFSIMESAPTISIVDIKQKFLSRKTNILTAENWEKLVTPRFETDKWQE